MSAIASCGTYVWASFQSREEAVFGFRVVLYVSVYTRSADMPDAVREFRQSHGVGNEQYMCRRQCRPTHATDSLVVLTSLALNRTPRATWTSASRSSGL